ncbi:MAG: lysophospholipid acyltransferase family protein [Pseudomonas sp.]|uniref:lysophospholipid acyltransferase family protein n=1 Tax=Pseudomonas sp. TaxID=306 RepID=UPI003BB55AA7
MSALRLGWRSLLLVLWGLSSVLLAGGLRLAEYCARRELPGLRQQLSQVCFQLLRACLPVQVQVHGQLPTQTALWVSNHVSWVDIALLGALQPLSFLSKAEVRQWPLAGWLAVQAGTLFIQRGAGDSAKIGQQITTHLQAGRALLLFPEGTTSDGQCLRTFHGQLLSGVIEQPIALQPVAIRYWRDGQLDTAAAFIGEDDLLSHLRRLLAAPAAQVQIHLLPPLFAKPGENRKQLARRAQACIAHCLDNLPAPQSPTSATTDRVQLN